jgi:hypothetical protein
VLPPLVLLPVRALAASGVRVGSWRTVACCVCSKDRFATDKHHHALSDLAYALGRPSSAVPAGQELKEQNSKLYKAKKDAWLIVRTLGGKVCTRTAQIHVMLRPHTHPSPECA